jgi:hypothetical protein
MNTLRTPSFMHTVLMQSRVAVLGLLTLLLSPAAWAEGQVTHLSGPVQVQQADGKAMAARVGAKLSEGQTLVTGKGAYARLEMSDGGEMVLRPETQLKIESYRFEKANPIEDTSVYKLLQGGLRAITGLISKRGNRDAYRMNTVTATIGIRGTQYDVRLCQADCGALADGTYVAVRFGAVAQSNVHGELVVSVGQVGYAAAGVAPVRLPRDPGIGFTPPPGIPKLDEKKKLEAAAVSAGTDNVSSSGTAASGSATMSTDKPTLASIAASSSGSSTVDAQQSVSPVQADSPLQKPALNASTLGTGAECSVQ